MRFLISWFFSIAIFCCTAQNKVPGYVVIHGSDTLRGEIHMKGQLMNTAVDMLYSRLIFIYNGEEYRITPGEVLEFGFEWNKKQYKFRSILAKWSKLLIQKTRVQFVQVLAEGVIGFYKYGDGLDEVITPNAFFYKDGVIEYIKIDDIKFLQQVRRLFADDYLILDQLGKPGYQKEDIVKMVREYNIRKSYKRI